MYSTALVCLCVCVCVTTITKKIVDGFEPNFMGRFKGEREDQVRVSLRSVEGCGSNGQKLCKPAIIIPVKASILRQRLFH